MQKIKKTGQPQVLSCFLPKSNQTLYEILTMKKPQPQKTISINFLYKYTIYKSLRLTVLSLN